LAGTPTATSYTDTGLNPQTTYYYTVATVHSKGESEQSSPVSASTPAEAPIQPPGGLSASALGTSSIQVSWNTVSGATGYRVHRSNSASGTYNFVGSASSSPYTNTGLSANTTYYYKVSSVKNSEESAMPSNYASATTQSGGGVIEYPPIMPTGLVVSTASLGSISLTWNSVSTATTYNVYRAYTQTGTPAKINTVTGTSCTDNVPAGAAYYYTVIAVNSSGESPRSVVAFAFAVSHYPLSNYNSAQILALANNNKHYYRLAVIKDTSYTITWQDGENKDIPGPYWGDDPIITVTAYQNDGSQIFSRNSGGYTNPAVFTATATGFVTLVVEYTRGTSQNYQIYYY
jgi:hypothetical protein